MALEDPAVDVVLDPAQLLGAQGAGMGEVEAELVGADIGAGLVHVGAEPAPQGGVQQMRGGVVALGGVARRAVDVGHHALTRLERAVLGHQLQHLVGAEPDHVLHAGAAAAAGALDHARVRHLAAAGRVERRLDQLDQHAAVVADRRADRGLRIGVS